MLKKRIALGAALVVVSLTLAGCSSKGTDAPAAADGSLLTDFGVTDDTITLGVLSDLSAVYGPLGQALVAGNQLYFDERNANGGICGRQVELDVRDHASDPQKAQALFQQLEPDVLGFTQVLGSPVIAALQPSIHDANTLAFMAGWSSDFLGDDNIIVTGTTYAVDTINGISYLMDEGKLQAGDTIGHVYFDGDFGGDALKGSTYAADELGLNLRPIVITPKDTDLAAQVSQLQAAGVKAIVVSAGPKQLASIAGQTGALGMDIPILTNTPAYNPALLESPAGPSLEKNLYLVTSLLPYAGEGDVPQKVAELFNASGNSIVPNIQVNYGYSISSIFGKALDVACENGDLSREGVGTAMRSLKAIDTGLTPAQDLSNPKAATTTESFILRAVNGLPGGNALETKMGSSKTAESYIKG